MLEHAFFFQRRRTARHPQTGMRPLPIPLTTEPACGHPRAGSAFEAPLIRVRGRISANATGSTPLQHDFVPVILTLIIRLSFSFGLASCFLRMAHSFSLLAPRRQPSRRSKPPTKAVCRSLAWASALGMLWASMFIKGSAYWPPRPWPPLRTRHQGCLQLQTGMPNSRH